MKKVLIIVAGLFGAALLTTSCVETQESATVTAMREAKLAQLQALADQERYQAQLDSIEAAIKNATSAAELEALQLQHQQAMLALQQQIENLQRQIENGKNENIISLFNAYKGEVSELNGLKSQLNTATANLANYENSFVSAEKAVATQIAFYQGIIDEDSAKLLAYQAYSGLDYDELQAEVTKLTVDKEIANSELNVAKRERYNTLEPKNELIAPFDYENGVNKDSHRILIAMDSIKKLSLSTNSIFGKYYSGSTIDYQETNINIKDERFENSNDILDGIYNEYLNSITIKARSILPEYILQMSYDIKKAIGEPAKDATATTAAVLATNLYLDVETANNTLKSANDALAAAQKGTDEEAIINAQKKVYAAQRGLAEAQDILNKALIAQAAFARLVDEVDINGEAYKAYTDEINALASNEVIVAYFDACVAYDTADDNYTEVNAQLRVAQSLLDASTDIDAKIEELEKSIANNQQNISNLGNINEYEDNDGDGYADAINYGAKMLEILIQQTNDEIARLNEEIAIQQQIVDAAKAALDAALAGESTPAE